MDSHTLPLLPPAEDLETKRVLKALATTHRYLAELKGLSETIPNQNILVNTLALQEAKDSSEIENIITTHDEMYQATLGENLPVSSATKEVQNYAEALQLGFSLVSQDQLLTNKHILNIQETLEKNNAGFRKLPGTSLKNDKTGQVIYTPPQDHDTIIQLMKNLENYINDDSISDVDALIKMAVIHYQFESIHPFYDGNGRTGRIINILYLVLKDLLDIPILYLSQYIINNKSDYYRLLQSIRVTNEWEEWILYILKGVEITARQTILMVQNIRDLMQEYKTNIRSNFKFYSHDLLNNLFRHPYTRIEFIVRDLNVTRLTATKYLDELTQAQLLEKHKIGKHVYFINRRLFNLLIKPQLFND